MHQIQELYIMQILYRASEKTWKSLSFCKKIYVIKLSYYSKDLEKTRSISLL